jgi:CDGSH-type Zn-finger protein
MSEPVIADNKPATVDLDAGEEYLWCACGRSSNQPFCDGSHAGTGITPTAFSPDESGAATLCVCKRTGTAPYCDGSHARFRNDQVGTAEPVSVRVNGSDAPSPKATIEEPTVEFIHQLARDGLSKMGHHGPMAAMGVPRHTLPNWDDLQIMVAQLATQPLLDEVEVGTELVIGPQAAKPLRLDIPLFVSDMSFGALSEEAKVALAIGAELAGTGICSGEGGMLPEEQHANSRYFYELASAKFGYREELLRSVQAFHFKGGQGAKTGTGGLRTPIDFVKALALGADGVAVSNSAMQAIGCVAARICNSNNCPAGIATQKPELRARLDVDSSARRLARFFEASVELMSVMARACGHDDLSKFSPSDLATWDHDMAQWSGVRFSGAG